MLDKVLKDVDPVDLRKVAVDLDPVAQAHSIGRSGNQTAAVVIVVVVAAVVVDDGLRVPLVADVVGALEGKLQYFQTAS